MMGTMRFRQPSSFTPVWNAEEHETAGAPPQITSCVEGYPCMHCRQTLACVSFPRLFSACPAWKGPARIYESPRHFIRRGLSSTKRKVMPACRTHVRMGSCRQPSMAMLRLSFSDSALAGTWTRSWPSSSLAVAAFTSTLSFSGTYSL